jgi:ATP-dependent protease ClpP protease subunit
MTKSYPIRCRIRDEGEITRVDVYDDIGSGLFGGVSSADFANAISATRGPLEVHINSGGGNVFEGVAIAEALRSYKGKVTTYVDGLAASIASVILQAGVERVVAPGSMTMIHEASTVTEGSQVDHEKAAVVLGKVSDSIADTYARRAGGTKEGWREAMLAESWYTAEEAVGAGLADRIAGEVAIWPEGLDVGAFSTAPDRIMNGIRKMSARGSLKVRNAVMHGDHELYDPDGDGDCDACPEGDTDHDFWSKSGKQLKPVPGKPMPNKKATSKRKVKGAKGKGGKNVDKSSWDASKAWHAGAESDDPAAFYAGICAGRKEGDPAQQSSWALPWRYSPSSPPNAAGVRNALARLDQTDGLTNKDAARAKLQKLMKRINPKYKPSKNKVDPAALAGLLAEALGKGA